MQHQILAFSGKKCSGKNTSFTCIRRWRPDAIEFAFASPLKELCIDILGLEYSQVFGDDEQKRTLIDHLLWENFPVPAWQKPDGSVHIGCPHADEYKPKKGPMTVREVLQYWGTEIFRKQYHNVWADACIRKIRKVGCPLAVITDCRFPNEVEVVQQAGGKVIKLTRTPFPEDTHPSEIALDPANFDQNKFDFILVNSNITINEQCEALYGLMCRLGIVLDSPFQDRSSLLSSPI